MSWYRIKATEKYKHKCTAGCGVFLKNKMKCYGCVGDLLTNRVPGRWRKILVEERQQKNVTAKFIVAETRAIYAGLGI